MPRRKNTEEEVDEEVEEQEEQQVTQTTQPVPAAQPVVQPVYGTYASYQQGAEYGGGAMPTVPISKSWTDWFTWEHILQAVGVAVIIVMSVILLVMYIKYSKVETLGKEKTKKLLEVKPNAVAETKPKDIKQEINKLCPSNEQSIKDQQKMTQQLKQQQIQEMANANGIVGRDPGLDPQPIRTYVVKEEGTDYGGASAAQIQNVAENQKAYLQQQQQKQYEQRKAMQQQRSGGLLDE